MKWLTFHRVHGDNAIIFGIDTKLNIRVLKSAVDFSLLLSEFVLLIYSYKTYLRICGSIQKSLVGYYFHFKLS